MLHDVRTDVKPYLCLLHLLRNDAFIGQVEDDAMYTARFPSMTFLLHDSVDFRDAAAMYTAGTAADLYFSAVVAAELGYLVFSSPAAEHALASKPQPHTVTPQWLDECLHLVDVRASPPAQASIAALGALATAFAQGMRAFQAALHTTQVPLGPAALLCDALACIAVAEDSPALLSMLSCTLPQGMSYYKYLQGSLRFGRVPIPLQAAFDSHGSAPHQFLARVFTSADGQGAPLHPDVVPRVAAMAIRVHGSPIWAHTLQCMLQQPSTAMEALARCAASVRPNVEERPIPPRGALRAVLEAAVRVLQLGASPGDATDASSHHALSAPEQLQQVTRIAMSAPLYCPECSEMATAHALCMAQHMQDVQACIQQHPLLREALQVPLVTFVRGEHNLRAALGMPSQGDAWPAVPPTTIEAALQPLSATADVQGVNGPDQPTFTQQCAQGLLVEALGTLSSSSSGMLHLLTCELPEHLQARLPAVHLTGSHQENLEALSAHYRLQHPGLGSGQVGCTLLTALCRAGYTHGTAGAWARVFVHHECLDPLLLPLLARAAMQHANDAGFTYLPEGRQGMWTADIAAVMDAHRDMLAHAAPHSAPWVYTAEGAGAGAASAWVNMGCTLHAGGVHGVWENGTRDAGECCVDGVLFVLDASADRHSTAHALMRLAEVSRNPLRAALLHWATGVLHPSAVGTAFLTLDSESD